eukprot:13448078-Alexandrium_andersonii.AAC.1
MGVGQYAKDLGLREHRLADAIGTLGRKGPSRAEAGGRADQPLEAAAGCIPQRPPAGSGLRRSAGCGRVVPGGSHAEEARRPAAGWGPLPQGPHAAG